MRHAPRPAAVEAIDRYDTVGVDLADGTARVVNPDGTSQEGAAGFARSVVPAARGALRTMMRAEVEQGLAGRPCAARAGGASDRFMMSVPRRSG
ncbi:MAG: hypothetical protein HY701_09755 [Gemmatimonadetes bacterium]|nr:hypothetical protein [Gemmatimonadota bacterium]